MESFVEFWVQKFISYGYMTGQELWRAKETCKELLNAKKTDIWVATENYKELCGAMNKNFKLLNTRPENSYLKLGDLWVVM